MDEENLAEMAKKKQATYSVSTPWGYAIEADTIEELQEELFAVLTKVERDYTEEIARIKAKYDEEEPPELVDIPAEAWVKAFDEAKSVRVKNVSKELHKLRGLPRWMGEYFPGEAADAIVYFRGERSDEEGALRYVIRWLGDLVEELEERAEEFRRIIRWLQDALDEADSRK